MLCDTGKLDKLDELALKLLSLQFKVSKLDGYSKNNIFKDIESEVFFSYFRQRLKSKRPIIYPVFLDSEVRKSLTENFQELDVSEIKSINEQIKGRIREQFKELTELSIEDYVNLFHLIGTLRSYGDECEEDEIVEIYKGNLEFLREDIYTDKNRGKIPGFVKLSIRQIMVDLKLKLKRGLDRVIEQLEGGFQRPLEGHSEMSLIPDEFKAGLITSAKAKYYEDLVKSLGNLKKHLEDKEANLNYNIEDKEAIIKSIEMAEAIATSIKDTELTIESIDKDLDINGSCGIRKPINRFKIVYITFYYYPNRIRDRGVISKQRVEIIKPYTNILDRICNGWS